MRGEIAIGLLGIPLLTFGGCPIPAEQGQTNGNGNVNSSTTDTTQTLSNGGENTNTAGTTQTPPLPPPPSPIPEIKMAADWQSPESVNVDLNWKLPSGAWFKDVVRTAWSQLGAEAAAYPIASLPSGVHEFWYTLDGAGRAAHCTYSLDFLDLKYYLSGLLQGKVQRKIIAEVADGHAHTLFHGWLPASDPAAGGPSGLYPAETQIAWRHADDEVNCDLSMLLPNGTWLNRYEDGWAQQGFERVVYPRDVALQDGTHQINFQFNGSGRSAEVTHFVDFPGFKARMDERILGPECRIIGLDYFDGTTRVLFNGWRPFGAGDAGGLTGAYPAEILAAWRNASEDVNVDIELVDPDGVRYTVWRNGWLHQGFEYAHIASGLVPKDGVWVLYFELNGTGRSADVKVDARFGNWSFTKTTTMLGYTERRITLSVVGGVASVLTNTWN